MSLADLDSWRTVRVSPMTFHFQGLNSVLINSIYVCLLFCSSVSLNRIAIENRTDMVFIQFAHPVNTFVLDRSVQLFVQ